MSENDEQRQALFDFLTDNIFGRERDAVTRAIYEVAEGDPHSYPVGVATLLIACARQMARLPENVRDRVKELQTLVEKVTQVEDEMLAKLGRENLATHSAIKAEATQLLTQFKTEFSRNLNSFTSERQGVQEAWNEVVRNMNSVLTESHKVHSDLKPVVDAAQGIARDYQSVQAGLKLHEDFSRKTLEAVESLKLIHQENQMPKHARANWISVGYMTGMVLAAFCDYMPWWAMWAAFGGGLALLQWLSHREDEPRKEQLTDPAKTAV